MLRESLCRWRAMRLGLNQTCTLLLKRFTLNQQCRWLLLMKRRYVASFFVICVKFNLFLSLFTQPVAPVGGLESPREDHNQRFLVGNREPTHKTEHCLLGSLPWHVIWRLVISSPWWTGATTNDLLILLTIYYVIYGDKADAPRLANCVLDKNALTGSGWSYSPIRRILYRRFFEDVWKIKPGHPRCDGRWPPRRCCCRHQANLKE